MTESTRNQIHLALDRALDGLATVSSVADMGDVARVHVQGRDRDYFLKAIWAGAGWPADVDRAISTVSDPPPRDLVVVARNLSPGARESLERQGVSWADSLGQARIVGPEFLVIRDFPRSLDGPPRTFSWSASALSVAEALLDRKQSTGIRTIEVANLTGWSTPQISQVLGAFDAEHWTVKVGPQRGPGASRDLAEGARLLEAWADGVARLPYERRFAERIFDDPMEFIADELGPVLDAHGVSWAVTGWAAAELLAPFVTAVPTIQIYVDERSFRGPLTQVMQNVPVRSVESGGRIEFRSADPGLFRLVSRHGGLPLVSAPRVYADLQALGGRGEDAAEHLRQEVILGRLTPKRLRLTSKSMSVWDTRCRERLTSRVAKELGDVRTVYQDGAWSVAYSIPETTLPSSELRDALAAVEGRETGWPPWWVPTREEIRPQFRNGAWECWFREDATRNHGHSDYWRAEPELKLFLLRGYQEDGVAEPGTFIDPLLPIWRMAECLRHSARMARRLQSDDIEFFARWTGLENRELRPLSSEEWNIPANCIAHDDSIAAYVKTSPGEIENDLHAVVRTLVTSLFEVFGWLDAPSYMFAAEISRMLEGRE